MNALRHGSKMQNLFPLASMLRALWMLMLVGPAIAQAAGDANPACLSRSTTGKQAHTHLVNGCRDKVTIYYCNAARPISGKRCGEQKMKDTVYYTHIRTLEPGDRSDISYPDDEVRVAACLAQPNPYRGDGFKSDSTGAFKCPAALSTASARGGQVRASALAASRGEACDKARSLFIASERERVACNCRQHARSDGTEVHFCQATGPIDEEEARSWDRTQDVQDWMRKALTCKPDGKTCPEGNRAVAIGVRG